VGDKESALTIVFFSIIQQFMRKGLTFQGEICNTWDNTSQQVLQENGKEVLLPSERKLLHMADSSLHTVGSRKSPSLTTSSVLIYTSDAEMQKVGKATFLLNVWSQSVLAELIHMLAYLIPYRNTTTQLSVLSISKRMNTDTCISHFFLEKTILIGILHYIQVIAFDLWLQAWTRHEI
ncbi:hypothetical protein ACJX0J_024124, partial [Zea mays]